MKKNLHIFHSEFDRFLKGQISPIL